MKHTVLSLEELRKSRKSIRNVNEIHEARAEADFEVNRKGEREVETILMHLENQNQLILRILERLDQQAEPSAPGEQGANFPAGLFNHPC